MNGLRRRLSHSLRDRRTELSMRAGRTASATAGTVCGGRQCFARTTTAPTTTTGIGPRSASPSA
jgi:hypothetical protein